MTEQEVTSAPINDGIFDLVSPDRAIELWKKIHSEGPPELDWKFYGRRKPNELEQANTTEACNTAIDETQANVNDDARNPTVNTEFDFDEDLSDLQADTSAANDSLCLKKRPEPGNQKTNLNDIVSDLMKGAPQSSAKPANKPETSDIEET